MEERLTQGKSRVEPAPMQNFVIERNIENRSNRGRMLECNNRSLNYLHFCDFDLPNT